MNVYDGALLSRWGLRRLHSAYEESAKSRTWTVPAIAGELAPRVTPGHWDLGRRTLEGLAQMGHSVVRHRSELWWQSQWQSKTTQHGLLTLTPQQQQMADEMAAAMETMKPQGFLNVRGRVRDHRDTRAVCETIAAGGKFFAMRDESTVLTPIVNDWIVKHAPQWGAGAEPVVVQIDEALLRWGGQHPRHLAAVALRAYWPNELDTPDSEVIRETKACLRAITGGGMVQVGPFAIEQVKRYGPDRDLMDTLRAHPCRRTRAAEATHPTFNENKPTELEFEDTAPFAFARDSNITI